MYYAVTGTLIVLMIAAGIITAQSTPVMGVFFAIGAFAAAGLMLQRWLETIENK